MLVIYDSWITDSTSGNINELPNLKELAICNSNLNIPPSNDVLEKLTLIDNKWNDSRDVIELCNLLQLKELTYDDNKPLILGGCPNLKKLHLKNAEYVRINNCDNLQFLILENSILKGSSIPKQCSAIVKY